MAGKQLGIRIPDSKVYEDFISYIEGEYGKTRGIAGLELQKALVQYLKNPKPFNINELKRKHEIELEKMQSKVLDMGNMHKKELQRVRDDHLKVEQAQKHEIGKLKQRITVAKSLNTQTEKLKEIIQKQEKDIRNLKEEKEYLQGLQEKNDQLQNQHDKLRNKHDHLQERFNKSQNELNLLERENSDLRVVVAKVGKMSLWERVLNRLPGEVKELKGKQ